MSSSVWRIRISDILHAIDKIQRYTEGMAFDAFAADEKTVDAVLWNLTVIGEAASHVPPDLMDRYPDIEWRSMRAMRNFLVHEYVKVDLPTVWDTVWESLPPLIPRLQAILASQ